jgi:hypothetical protein
MVYRPNDLTEEQRRTVESLLGRPLADDEDVSVDAVPRKPHLTAQEKVERLLFLGSYFDKVHAHQGALDSDETDELIDEALRSERPGYRPVR